MLVAINSFVRRQIKESPFSHFEGTDEELIKLVEDHWGMRLPSYRDDVFTVPVPPKYFYSGVVRLTPGDEFVGKYTSRVVGEAPRKQIFLCKNNGAQKGAAVAVDIVVYSHAVLAEDNDAETDAEYEIVSINARLTIKEQPINPMTLMHNHFGSEGGTATGLSSEEFESKMREAFLFWKDHAMLSAR